MQTNWYFVFPFANILFSFLVAEYIGKKRHIGFWYTFLWGIGFTFIFAWIVASMATPLTEMYKKAKKDIYTSVLTVFMGMLAIMSGVAIFKVFSQSGLLDTNSYGEAYNKKTIWQSVFFIIGALTTIKYIFDPFAEKKKIVSHEKEYEPTIKTELPDFFTPETPSYEVASRKEEGNNNLISWVIVLLAVGVIILLLS